MRNQMRYKGDAGFTLIEVVVALAILGTGLVILLETHYATLQLFGDAQEEATARILIESVVGEAETEVLAGNESGDGDFGRRYPDFAYTFTAVQLDETNMPGLFEVIVKLTGPQGEKELTFYTYDGTQVATDAKSDSAKQQ